MQTPDYLRHVNVLHYQIQLNSPNYYVFDYILNNSNATYMINQQDKEYGNTPLHIACMQDTDYECHYDKLIRHPALLINLRNDKGMTVFHQACYFMKTYIINNLLDNPGVDIMLIDFGGENALHHIIQRYCSLLHSAAGGTECLNKLSMECIHMLLTKNPYLVCQENNAKETAYDYACKWRDTRKHRHTNVRLNNKSRLLSDWEYDHEFWCTLANVLREYEMKGRHRIYTYILNSFTKNNPI